MFEDRSGSSVISSVFVCLFFIYNNSSMMFLNLLFCKDFYNRLKDFSLNTSSSLNTTREWDRLSKSKTSIAYILKDQNSFLDSKGSLATKTIERQKIGNRLTNDSWSQDIFLSLNNKSLNKYNVQINSLKIHQGQSPNKSLILNFSRCLFDGSIQVSSTSEIKYSQDSLAAIQYSWAKNLKLKYVQLHNIFSLNSNNKKNNNLSSEFFQKINLDQIPLFVISNHLGQMIISEPPTDLTVSKHFSSYSSIGNQCSNTYYGFFFTNHKDAQEYMRHIEKAYPIKGKTLKIFTCNFYTYYRALNNSKENIHFKLIPDLMEISNLIKKYKNSRHLLFHKEQASSRNYFKGQPIYLIKNGDLNVSMNISQKQNESYNIITLNYQEAMELFNRFSKNSFPNKKQKVNILVYNLEDFIQTQFKLEYENSSPCLVLPSRESYRFVKQDQLLQKHPPLYFNYLNTFSSISLWSKRIFWSLTSRQPSAYF